MIDALILLLPLILSVPAAVLLVQVVAAGKAYPTASIESLEPLDADASLRMAILVPAHDEADLIVSTVSALTYELAPGDRLLVVADNCTDGTARLAADAGAETVERCDPARRGKGHALDFGIRHLAANPPDAVVVIDADCRVSRGALRALAAAAATSGRPVQSANAMRHTSHPSLAQRIAAFAWVVKTWARPSGMASLGLPCCLMGTGMAFPWSLVTRLPLASSALAEDLELGIAAARAGAPPSFVPWVEVSSEFPGAREASGTQRRRWEQGSLSAISRLFGPLLGEAVRRGRPELLAIALDLAVPPLALLFLLVAATTPVVAAANYLAGSGSPMVYLGIGLPALLLTTAVGVAWFRFGRRCLSIADLACAPWYAASKVGMYLAVAFARRPEWTRTKRR